MTDIKKGPVSGSKPVAHVTIADRRQFLIGSAGLLGAATLGLSTGLGVR
ncbi:MAG: ABC transporter substrate-binding protein, partial [Mesorhizobium sp.]